MTPDSPNESSDPTRRRLREITALSRKKGRDATGEFLVEGVRSVEAAVVAGAPLVEILVSHEAAETERVAQLVESATCPVHVIAAHEMERLVDTRTSQGVAAVSRGVVSDSLPDVSDASFVVVLDGVQDPGNVGAIIRTAAWFGVDTVLMDAQSADPEGPKVVRASMGGLWDVSLARVSDLGAAVDQLQQSGLALWGADMEGESPGAWSPGSRLTLVFGSEAHGISDAVASRLVGRVCISRGAGARSPASGVESLNVVVAAGILMQAADVGRKTNKSPS